MKNYKKKKNLRKQAFDLACIWLDMIKKDNKYV